MGTHTKVDCPDTEYTQVTVAETTFAIVYCPKNRNGSPIFIHLATVQPPSDTDAFMVLEPDEYFPKPKGLDGHIWVKPSQDTLPVQVMEE